MKILRRSAIWLLAFSLMIPAFSGAVYAAESVPSGEEEQTVSVNLETPEEIGADQSEVLSDSDALLEQYLVTELGISQEPKNAVEQMVHRLSGRNYIAYSELRQSFKDIADGKSSETRITLSADTLNLPEDGWTAKDLGVSSLGTVTDGSVSISDEASAAINKNLINLELLMSTLLIDCPYELYWYDKTSDGGVKSQTGYTVSYTGSSINTIYITKITFAFAVSADYSVSGAGGTYQVDTDKTQQVASSVNTAKQIVTDYSSKGDIDKLTAYKDEITDRVSYNKTAADKSNNVNYGNPWQFIYVFDEDDSTNVVCEGYSKAFQYLCDMSSFSSSLVQTRLVSGTMTGGTGAGGHMWNLVTLDDGKNYVADITNSDSGTVGSAGQLFLAGLLEGTTMTSASEAYTLYAGINGIDYQYDSTSLSVYEDSELIVATGAYTPAEDPTEPQTEDPTEPQTEDPTEPETEDPTEPQTEDPTEPETEDPTEPQTEDPTEPQTEDPTEPQTEDPTEPQTEDPTEPQTEDPTEPETEEPTEPAVVKAENTIRVSCSNVKLKFSKVKKAAQKLKAAKIFTVKKAVGKVTYNKKSGNSKIVVASNGKITVKKGLKKGIYKVKVKVKAAGNDSYKAKTVTVSFKVVIK